MSKISRLLLSVLATAASTAAAEKTVAQGMNAFAAACYRDLAQQGKGNLVVSPYSIATNLSMLLEGARGRTASEIAAALRQHYPNAAYQQALSSLLGEIGNDGNAGGNELLSANAMWVDRRVPVIAEFNQRLRTLYQAAITKVDLFTNPERARMQINEWAEQHTKGKIHDLFPTGALHSDTGLVLTSATYFHGNWQSAFPRDATRPAPFKAGTGSITPMPFMNQRGVFGYAETPAAQILEMKYAGSPLAFDILLPQGVTSLADLENSITADKLDSWFASLVNRTIDVAIPQFRAESDFSLRDSLRRLGITAAFSGGADFSGIDDRRDLALSDVRHKAFVEVNEEGTTAAAATGAVVNLISMATPKRFRADHPFTFVIRDTKSRVILFTGRFLGPAQG